MTVKKPILLILFIYIAINIYATVMPHPQKASGIPHSLIINEPNNIYTDSIHKTTRTLPDSILVIRVDFNDQTFSETGVYPYADYPQDFEYFDKYMQHLRDFYLDASDEQYTLKYRIVPTVYRAPQNMSYYGDDAQESARRVYLVKWLVEQCDADGFDFTHYQGVIIFHAGAGQESDIYDRNPQTLWSSFLSKNTFRNILKDPDDEDYEDYQGLVTSNGGIVDRVAFLPACEFHNGFTEDFNHEFDIMGPLANQFGRILGFPALNGNTTGTAGAGNFCIMGTGTWNFNGKIPPLPSAWVRYYAGWSEPTQIIGSAENLQITYPMSKQSTTSKIYKLEITSKEYFLIENRQQNFLKDIIYINPVTGDTLIWDIHTFAGSENYDYSQGGIPIVNLMKNKLRGNEWDYHIPYEYDDENHIIGSGLFIWHIDENIIEANMANNTVNGDNLHYGVALEEADGIEHLPSPRPDYYMRGSPYDSFRAGNNDYFGKQFKTITVPNDSSYVVYSFPTANSYYDSNITMEIYNISPSDTLMTFSVRFDEWTQNFAQADFEGENYLEPFVGDLNQNGINEVYYFHSDGGFTGFENNSEIFRASLLGGTFSNQYTYDGDKNLLIPIQGNIGTLLYRYYLDPDPLLNMTLTVVWASPDNYVWAGSPLYIEPLSQWVLYVNYKPPVDSPQIPQSQIVILDSDFNEIASKQNDFYILSNVVYDKGTFFDARLIFAETEADDPPNTVRLYVVTPNLQYDKQVIISDLGPDIAGGKFTLYAGHFSQGYWGELSSTILYYTNGDINKVCIASGPLSENKAFSIIDIPYTLTGQPLFKDIDKNGRAEIVLPHANGFRVYTLDEQMIKDVVINSPQYENATGGGLIAINKPNTTNLQYLVGSFSANRIVWFDENLRQIPSKTKTLASPIRTLPYVYGQNVYQATDDGRIYTIPAPEIWSGHQEWRPYWSQLLGSYHRNAYWSESMTNIYKTNETFVKKETYVYPNPFIAQHHDVLHIRIMTKFDEQVKIKIYNIAGQLIAEKTENTKAYIANSNTTFDLHGLSSGMYFAIVSVPGFLLGNESMTLKFAIER